MTPFRLSAGIAAGSVLLAAGAMAADFGHGLPLDPQLLPPNTAPGDCVVRRVTGPGGAYRWDRVECDPDRGWTAFDAWGYGRPLAVETRPPHPSDRYGDRAGPSRRPDRGEDRYGPGPSQVPRYRVAGRDAAGFLVWPGKQP